MSAILAASGLGKRYRRTWALKNCTLDIPEGCVTGLVGPNGAGKTTLPNLAVGMLGPTEGTIEVCGGRPATDAAQLAKVGYVAQDTPTYANLSIADHLRMGAHLNPRWDASIAQSRIAAPGLDPKQKAGKLSGGQSGRPHPRARQASGPAHPRRARRQPRPAGPALVPAGAHGSRRRERAQRAALLHVVSDLERVCDYVVVLVDSEVRVEGDVESLLASHHRLTGPRRDAATLPADQHVVAESLTDRQSTFVIRTDEPILD
ncbi:MAG: ATP-binding cassette domain-containing protein, partial [Knoellia sp.]